MCERHFSLAISSLKSRSFYKTDSCPWSLHCDTWFVFQPLNCDRYWFLFIHVYIYIYILWNSIFICGQSRLYSRCPRGNVLKPARVSRPCRQSVHICPTTTSILFTGPYQMTSLCIYYIVWPHCKHGGSIAH